MSTSEAPTSVPGFSIQAFDGSFWGILVSIAIFGINIVQMWIYVNTNDDKWPLRSFVAVLFALDIAQTIISSDVVHYFLIEKFGNSDALNDLPITVNVGFGITVMVVFLVQLYFAGRVYLFHRNRLWIPAIIVTGAIGSFISGILSINLLAKGASRTIILVNDQMRVTIAIDHGFATVTDIVTTIALSWAVSPTRSGFRRTRELLQKLLLYTVTRGLLVTIVQLAFVIVYEAQPFSLTWTALHFCLAKIYLVTMITMLNSRTSLRSGLDAPIEITQSALVDQTYMGSSARATDPQDIVLTRMNTSKAARGPVGAIRKPKEAYNENYTHSLDEETAGSTFSNFKA